MLDSQFLQKFKFILGKNLLPEVQSFGNHLFPSLTYVKILNLLFKTRKSFSISKTQSYLARNLSREFFNINKYLHICKYLHKHYICICPSIVAINHFQQHSVIEIQKANEYYMNTAFTKLETM